MIPRASSKSLPEKDNPVVDYGPFLRVPPFPGALTSAFDGSGVDHGDPVERGPLLESVRRLRVGGTYWAAQPPLPPRYVLARSRAALADAGRMATDSPVILWLADGQGAGGADVQSFTGDCDPWHMLAGAEALLCASTDEILPIAVILGIPAFAFGSGESRAKAVEADPADLLHEPLFARSFRNPFTGQAMSAGAAVELCGFWRRLIDSNRAIAGALGFAFWKQDNVAPLLWDGDGPVRFLKQAPVDGTGEIAVWIARTSPDQLEALDQSGLAAIEVEDGFLRSQGLGADCVAPLSITVDRLGPYFDPAQASELERLLQDGHFDPEMLERAARLRRTIVDSGLGKYGRSDTPMARPAGNRTHILVPGQVEDDRSVQAGGCGLVSNLELLKRVRERCPDAHILYKPHPDVLAGHRQGHVPDAEGLRYADAMLADAPIAPVLDMVDEVHVNTSLAGFEALLRDKRVTTYGVPFYAGWGLTTDLGPVPDRRSTRRSVDELVAAALLIYPRYLDPLTGLPCPAEVVVDRLTGGQSEDPGILVTLRRMQGRLMRPFRAVSR